MKDIKTLEVLDKGFSLVSYEGQTVIMKAGRIVTEEEINVIISKYQGNLRKFAEEIKADIVGNPLDEQNAERFETLIDNSADYYQDVTTEDKWTVVRDIFDSLHGY